MDDTYNTIMKYQMQNVTLKVIEFQTRLKQAKFYRSLSTPTCGQTFLFHNRFQIWYAPMNVQIFTLFGYYLKFISHVLMYLNQKSKVQRSKNNTIPFHKAPRKGNTNLEQFIIGTGRRIKDVIPLYHPDALHRLYIV